MVLAIPKEIVNRETAGFGEIVKAAEASVRAGLTTLGEATTCVVNTPEP